MANFQLTAGMFVKVTKDFKSPQTGVVLKEGEIHQVISAGQRFALVITFVGVNGWFDMKLAGQFIEPYYGENK